MMLSRHQVNYSVSIQPRRVLKQNFALLKPARIGPLGYGFRN
jgi:hypothetical protein